MLANAMLSKRDTFVIKYYVKTVDFVFCEYGFFYLYLTLLLKIKNIFYIQKKLYYVKKSNNFTSNTKGDSH